jgi:hypothetical protein
VSFFHFSFTLGLRRLQSKLGPEKLRAQDHLALATLTIWLDAACRGYWKSTAAT